MSALGLTYRYRASNTQSQSIAVTLKGRPFKYDSTGALVYAAEQTYINNVTLTTLTASTGTTISAAVDNSTTLHEGVELTLSCTAQTTISTAGGTVAVFREHSTDGGTTWPSAGFGAFVGAYTVTAADATTARLSNHRVR